GPVGGGRRQARQSPADCTSPSGSLTHDPGVGEDVEGVAARRRELRDDRAFVAGLEGVERVRRDRVLLARPQQNVACAVNLQVHGTAADTERLLLARLALDRWVSMLRALLAREHDELFCAHAVGIHVDDDLQSNFLESAQTEVRDLDALTLTRR